MLPFWRSAILLRFSVSRFFLNFVQWVDAFSVCFFHFGSRVVRVYEDTLSNSSVYSVNLFAFPAQLSSLLQLLHIFRVEFYSVSALSSSVLRFISIICCIMVTFKNYEVFCHHKDDKTVTPSPCISSDNWANSDTPTGTGETTLKWWLTGTIQDYTEIHRTTFTLLAYAIGSHEANMNSKNYI